MKPTVRWNEVTAVLGGTFDPPHLGHREAVAGLFENPGVLQVLVVPSAIPPLKAQTASSEDRFRLAQLTFQGLKDVQLDRRELDRAAKSSKPSYTIDTIGELKREYLKLAFVVGADQLAALPFWHQFRELLSSCHWIVLTRKPDGENLALQILREWEASGLLRQMGSDWETSPATLLKLVPTPARELSSTEIRQEIARSGDHQNLLKWLDNRLTPAVLSDLMEHRLYGMRGQENFRKDL